MYLIAEVNGSGNTTSIAKLAQRLKDEGHSIALGSRLRFKAACRPNGDVLATAE